MADLGIAMFSNAYHHTRVLLSGHTGFKGSWLALWLQELGAQVTGIALPSASPTNHWDLLQLNMPSYEVDIRDGAKLLATIRETQPEIIFHLAAQSLVRRSYLDPIETWSTNIMGTANLLEACRHVPSIRAVVVVTTDKCYENEEWPWGYRESDRLGGHDPYSASKACAELVTASYRSAFFHSTDSPLLASARAGNVIGGGDWAADRLIPDLARAYSTGNELEVRSPRATRPWQHVLDSLSGYLALGQRLLAGDSAAATAWNFGPGPEANQTVATVLERMACFWPGLRWHQSTSERPHEATLLYLDSAKARAELGWRIVWTLDETLAATAAWYQKYEATGQPDSRSQLDQFTEKANAVGLDWAKP